MPRGYVPGSTGLRAWLRRFRCHHCRVFIWRQADRQAWACKGCVPF